MSKSDFASKLICSEVPTGIIIRNASGDQVANLGSQSSKEVSLKSPQNFKTGSLAVIVPAKASCQLKRKRGNPSEMVAAKTGRFKGTQKKGVLVTIVSASSFPSSFRMQEEKKQKVLMLRSGARLELSKPKKKAIDHDMALNDAAVFGLSSFSIEVPEGVIDSSQSPSPTFTQSPSPSSSPTPSSEPGSPQAEESFSPSGASASPSNPAASPSPTPTPQPTNINSSVLFTTENETSSLNRQTRQLTSSVDIKIKNTSRDKIVGPLYLVINLTFPGGEVNPAINISGNQGVSALGGYGTGPFGKFYLDLTSLIPQGGLDPDATITTKLQFVRAATLRFTYALDLIGLLEPIVLPPGGRPPVLSVVPETITVERGQVAEINASATDPNNDYVSLTAGPKIPNSVFNTAPGKNPNGKLRFTPGSNDKGEYNFSFFARDETGLAVSKTARVIVVDTNRAPSVVSPATSEVKVGESLTFAVQVSDPDGDIVNVSTPTIPANGVFLESTRIFTFIPDESQIGTKVVSFIANDGSLTSNLSETVINVLPRSGSGGGSPSLSLLLNPVSNPVLAQRVRITGAVNDQLGSPPPSESIALITGLSPSTGEQGKALTVLISSQGNNPTHFEQGKSTITFGQGINVKKLTVTSPTTATAEIFVSPSASVGSRSVQVVTEDEVALSVVAFNVLKGKTVIRGVLKDPETGAPISGARVTIEGTGMSVVSGADGSFLFSDAPAGPNVLIVNSLNRVTQRIDITPEANEEFDLGEFGSPSLVFDPATAPSISVGSILGRGAGDLFGNLSFEQAKQLVLDSIIATGGSDAGALDEFGNQLNPLVLGSGIVSTPNAFVEDQALRLMKKETMSLFDFLYAFSFHFEWEGGAPPSLPKWLEALQARVNAAWAEPNLPENKIVTLIFNKGRTIGPVPPILGPDTQLTAIQAHLLATSWLAYADTLSRRFASNSLGDKVSDFFIATAYAQAASPNNGLMGFWETINTTAFSTAFKGKLVSTFGTATFNIGLNAIGRTSTLPTLNDFSSSLSSALVTGFADVLSLYMQRLTILSLIPKAPLILEVQKISEPIGNDQERDVAVVLRTTRTYGDQNTLNPPGKKFYYRLWRTSQSNPMALISAGQVNEDVGSNSSWNPLTGPKRDPYDTQHLLWVDYAPDDGQNLYYVDVIRTVGENPDTVPTGLPLWTKFIPNISFGYSGWASKLSTGASLNLGGSLLGKFNPASALTSLMTPMMNIANAIRKMGSPMSTPKGVWIGKGARYDNIPVGGLAIDPGSSIGYVSYPSISRIKVLDMSTATFINEFDPGFKAPPAQSGLAIGYDGTLYSQNAASNDSFGGKIFSYQRGSFSRAHVGMTNYYSFMLGYAKPTSVPALSWSPDGQILALDLVDTTVKKIDVSATYDPYRRVGQPVLSGSALDGVSPKSDMATSFLGTTLITTSDNVINFNPLSGQSSRLFQTGSSPFLEARSAVTDARHTLYLAGLVKRVSQANTEGIVALPTMEQNLWSSFADSDGCRLDRHLIVRDLFDVTHVRVSQDGDRMLYLDTGGTPRVRGFGVSGQILKPDGSALQNATVTIGGAFGAVGVPQRTNACGTFHFLNVRDNPSHQLPVEMTISHPDFGTQRQLVILENTGQTFRDIIMEPPVVDPTEPTEQLVITPIEFPRVPFTLSVDGPKSKGGFHWIDMQILSPPVGTQTPPSPARQVSSDILNIFSPVSRSKTAATQIVVNGTVDDERVTTVSLSVNGIVQSVPVVNGLFTADVNINRGRNVILATTSLEVNGRTFTSYSPAVVVESIENYSGVGTVSGVVKDSSAGGSLTGVPIELESGEKTYTDGRGVFVFKNVAPGENAVKIVKQNGDPVPLPGGP